MKQQVISATASAFAWTILMTVPAPASAHIVMVDAILSRDNDVYGDAQKMFPCDGPRTQGTTYTFEPGAMITLSVSEGVPHPSYFRIAFDNEGEDSFIEPKSIDPTDVDPTRPCPYDAKDQCGIGKADFCNVVSTTGGPTVLWDNLDPHNPSLLDLGKKWSWTIKLPDVECENCTLQVIQVMEDVVHGAYCPQGSCTDNSLEDIYHRCINIKLKRGAGNTPGTVSGPAQNKGVDCLAGQGEDAGVPDASTGNDASVGGDAGSAGATAGGTAGGATLGGGSGGTTGVPGGVAGGAAGGTGTAGGVAGTTGGGTGIVGGGASTSGTTGAGIAGGVASGTTSGTVPPGEDAPNDDGCDCAVSDGSPRYGNLISMAFLALALLWRRRHVQY